MKKIYMRMATLLSVVGALCAVAIGVTSALAASEDNNWTPSRTQFKAISANSAFTASGATDECQVFELRGMTPPGDQAKGSFNEQEAQGQTKVDPRVANCNDETTVNGPWHVSLHSEGKGFEGQCPENVGEKDDCLTLHIPNEGAKINLVICTVKVKENNITVPYNDETGEATATAVPVAIEGGGLCSGVTEAKFKGIFKIRAMPQKGQPTIIKDGE